MALLRVQKQPHEPRRVFFFAGAPAAAIQLIYAATEAPMLQWFVDDSCKGDDARIPIGYPLPGNRLALVDEEGRATLPFAANLRDRVGAGRPHRRDPADP